MSLSKAIVYTCALALVLAPTFLAPKVHASNHDKPFIAVAPFLQKVEIGSDQPTKTIKVSFANDSKTTQELIISIADFGNLDDTGGVAFVGGDFGGKANKYGLSSWLTLDKNRVKIEPGKKVEVTATITNKPDLAPGGHYAAIIGTVLSPERPGSTKVDVKQKISSLVFAVKTGGEKYDLSLQDVSSDGSLFKLPTEVSATLKSTGNVHVVPRGIVYIKDKSGKVISKGAINLKSGLVLPETQRTFAVPLTALEKPSIFQKDFTIQVDYRYDGYPDFASKSTGFTYVNPLIFVILAPFILLLWALRNYLSYSDFKFREKLLKMLQKPHKSSPAIKHQTLPNQPTKKPKKINITSE